MTKAVNNKVTRIYSVVKTNHEKKKWTLQNQEYAWLSCNLNEGQMSKSNASYLYLT